MRRPVWRGRIVFGPQGFVVFAVLVLLFARALFWLVRARPVALKVVAGVMAFPPAMLFGVALVNDFYGYYESWDDAWRDLTNQAPASVATVPDLGGRLDRVLQRGGAQAAGAQERLRAARPRSPARRAASAARA